MFTPKTQRNSPQITNQVVFPYTLLTANFSIGPMEKHEDNQKKSSVIHLNLLSISKYLFYTHEIHAMVKHLSITWATFGMNMV